VSVDARCIYCAAGDWGAVEGDAEGLFVEGDYAVADGLVHEAVDILFFVGIGICIFGGGVGEVWV
jgi:hypothetical protein